MKIKGKLDELTGEFLVITPTSEITLFRDSKERLLSGINLPRILMPKEERMSLSPWEYEDSPFVEAQKMAAMKVADPEEVIMSFGKHRGKHLKELGSSSLRWYVNTIDDPNPNQKHVIEAMKECLRLRGE